MRSWSAFIIPGRGVRRHEEKGPASSPGPCKGETKIGSVPQHAHFSRWRQFGYRGAVFSEELELFETPVHNVQQTVDAEPGLITEFTLDGNPAPNIRTGGRIIELEEQCGRTTSLNPDNTCDHCLLPKLFCPWEIMLKQLVQNRSLGGASRGFLHLHITG